MTRLAQPRPDEPIRIVLTKTGTPRYRVVIDGEPYPNGKRRQVRATFDSLREARAFVTRHRADRSRGVLVTPDKQPFRTYALAWHAARSRRVREVTASSYAAVLKRPLAHFGAKPLAKVTRADIEAVLAELDDAGRSKRTASLTLFVLRSIFEQALDENLIARNPARNVDAYGRAKTERQPLSLPELERLRAHLAADDLAACWLLTLYGLRRSEVLGLRWSAVDLASEVPSISIESARVVVDGNRTVESGPKSERGRRTLHLPGEVATALRELRERHARLLGFEHVRTGLVATDVRTDRIGNVCHAAPVVPKRWSMAWRAYCAAAGVPSVPLHAARHSSVTAMLANGVAAHLVAAWHGHSVAVAHGVYNHPFAEQIAAAGAALSVALGGSAG